MKVALVHDYLNEFGGAERVLLALSEIWPKAPIYTAFYRKDSPAYERFQKKKIIVSWAQKVPFFSTYLHSPLRFLAPLVWNSFDFSDFDVVVTSSSWYVTKGIKGNKWAKGDKGPIEICYCHTPPRYLYGYPTSIEWQRYWPVRVYGLVVNHFMRVYDFESAQRVDYFIANSREVAARIKKFYRREAQVIYPPVDIERLSSIDNRHPGVATTTIGSKKRRDSIASLQNDSGYFLVVSRLVASKNVDIAVEVCAKLGLPLKVVGTGRELKHLKKLIESLPISDDRHKKVKNGEQKVGKSTIEFLEEVDDEGLIELYQNCRAVIFAASQEDFGLVPVEAMAAGKPVIACAEGGVVESVIDASTGSAQAGKMKGKCTGVYFDPPTAGSLTLAINNFLDLEKKGYFDPKFIKRHAQKFSKERFKREILKFVGGKMRNAKF